MSKKSFILLALVINLTICISLCVLLLTGKAGKTDSGIMKNSENRQIDKEVDDTASQNEMASERPSNQAIVNIEDTTVLTEESGSDHHDSSDDNSNFADGNHQEDHTESEKIVEEQVETDTTPYNYKNDKPKETSNENDEHHDEQSEGRDLDENGEENETVEVGGTVAYLLGGCNIRSYRDVGDNIIGYANEGESYQIEPSQCTESWVAVYIDDTTIGYIATSYCSIE